MLEKFEEMSLMDAKRAFIIYLNFIKINKEIRKMSSSIIQEFNIKIDITFYDIDAKVAEALKLSIETREREKSVTSQKSGSFLRMSGGSGIIGGGTSCSRQEEANIDNA